MFINSIVAVQKSLHIGNCRGSQSLSVCLNNLDIVVTIRLIRSLILYLDQVQKFVVVVIGS